MLSRNYVLNNRYRIENLIDQGGFGAVYRARDLKQSNRVCAVKENLDNSSMAQQQFRVEAQLLRNLSHPNLPKVFDDFVAPNGQQYLVMEFVAGEDLKTMVERLGAPKESDVIAWMIQISDVLIYLHRNNPPIIHRDIKPANVRIMPKGKAILVDFGIAKTYDPARQTTLGARGVTPGFSPIEQYGHGRTDARSDIYSLGATMYFCLTRKEPPESTRRADQSQPEYLVPPRQINSSISSDLEHLILGTLELFKHQRIQTAQEVRDILINIQRGLPPTLPVPLVPIAPTTPVPPSLAQPGVPAKISGVLQYLSQPRIFSDGYSKKHYEFTVEVQPGVGIPCMMEGYMLPVYSLFNGANVQVDGVLGTNNIFQVIRLTETQSNRVWTPKPKIGWAEQLKIALGLTNP